jgi:hypothetical protein
MNFFIDNLKLVIKEKPELLLYYLIVCPFLYLSYRLDKHRNNVTNGGSK